VNTAASAPGTSQNAIPAAPIHTIDSAIATVPDSRAAAGSPRPIACPTRTEAPLPSPTATTKRARDELHRDLVRSAERRRILVHQHRDRREDSGVERQLQRDRQAEAE
jgi:hypothetical protein